MTTWRHDHKATAGRLSFDEPMARHSSWKVGGPARRYYQPRDLEELCEFLATLQPAEPLTWVGLGSNVLVRDGGLPGTVIAPAGRLSGLRRAGDRRVRAEAGVYCARLARFCVCHALTGAEFLAGIPGTIGGALAMNAGAFGSEIWQHVVAVETVDRHGRLHLRGPCHYRVGYRSVVSPIEEWFVAALLEFERSEPAVVKARMRALLRRRGTAQPTNRPSCGSVFRNPAGDHAARLIESAGLKGAKLGGAQVSTKHANFIVNAHAATAAQIEALIEHVAEVVERVHGVRLLPEVRILGRGSPLLGRGGAR